MLDREQVGVDGRMRGGMQKKISRACASETPVTFTLSSPLSFEPISQTTGASRYSEICANCPSCSDCDVANEKTIPICTPAFEHTTSAGGSVNLQNLVLDKGFWRVTPVSRKALPCYREEACLGGITDSPDFCDGKFKGPCRCQDFRRALNPWGGRGTVRNDRKSLVFNGIAITLSFKVCSRRKVVIRYSASSSFSFSQSSTIDPRKHPNDYETGLQCHKVRPSAL